jgi:hypothetical protein
MIAVYDSLYKARPAQAGQMSREEAGRAAGLFLYGGEDMDVDMDNLFGARKPIWEPIGVGT